MSADSAKDRALLVIQAAHTQLSKFAQDSYGMHGRGVTLVSVPGLPAGATILLATEMVYHELAAVRRMTANMKDRSDAAVLIRMIETVRPSETGGRYDRDRCGQSDQCQDATGRALPCRGGLTP